MAVLAVATSAANAAVNVDTAAAAAGQAHYVSRVIIVYAGGDALPSGQKGTVLVQSPAGTTLHTVDEDIVVGERLDLEVTAKGATAGVVRLVVPAAGAGVRATGIILGETAAA